MEKEIEKYNYEQSPEDQKICNLLMNEINKSLPSATSKIWHGSPVWFLDYKNIVKRKGVLERLK